MLNDNIRNIRKAKRMSQEELAVKLCVVRQTISKWEKGYSVPDSEMLIKIAETLEVSVSQLLGKDTPDMPRSKDDISEQLERINEQLAIKNRRTKTVFKVIVWIVAGVVLLNALLVLLGIVGSVDSATKTETYTETQLEPNN